MKTGDRSAFTLIELLIATLISALIILSLNTLLYNTLHLRDRAYEDMQGVAEHQQVLSTLKRDLQNTIHSEGLLASGMTGVSQPASSRFMDQLEFTTTSGKIYESEPWGDIQKIQYSMQELSLSTAEEGYYLVRSLTRNLLATIQETDEEQALLARVHSLQFQYYDGESWLSSWDSETQDPALPLAVRVQILQYEQDPLEQNLEQRFKEIAFIVPLRIEEVTSSASSEEEVAQDGSESNE